MRNEDIKTITGEKSTVEIGAEKIELKELSIRQSLELTQYLSKKFIQVTKGIAAKTKLEQMTINDILEIIMTSMDEDEILELLRIITDKPKEWWKANFKLAAALKVIRLVLEGEKIGEVFQEALQIYQLIRQTVSPKTS